MLIAICLLLIGSIGGNLIAYNMIYNAIDKYNDSRLDPIGELNWQLHKIAEGNFDIVILGDSHARNWEIDRDGGLNLGIPSQTSQQICMRSNLYKDNISGKILIVFAGGNDLKSISTNVVRKNAIVKNCILSIKKIVKNHKEKFENIVLVTIPPAFNIPIEYRIIYSKIIDEAHLEINNGIKKIGLEEKCTVIDAYEIIRKKMSEEILFTDGIHMNQNAYDYLNKKLYNLQLIDQISTTP